MAADCADRAVEGDDLAGGIDLPQGHAACVTDHALTDAADGGENDTSADMLVLCKGLYTFQQIVAPVQALADGFHSTASKKTGPRCSPVVINSSDGR